MEKNQEKTTASNAALTTLEKMGVQLSHELELDINGVELKFIFDNAAYDQFVNDVKEDNKLTPSKDYLLALIAPEHRSTLLEIINLPNVALTLMAEVNKAFVPKLDITVKKSKGVLRA